MLSGIVRRVSEELLSYLSVQAMFGATCFILENLQKAKFYTSGIFKHQNTKTSLYKLSKNHWAIGNFWVRQKKFTIHSLFGSPCISHKVCFTGQAVQAVKVLSTLSQMVWGTFLFVSKRANNCLREARIVCALFSSILQSQNADGGNRVRKSAPRCLLDRAAWGVTCYLDIAHLNRPLFKKGLP